MKRFKKARLPALAGLIIVLMLAALATACARVPPASERAQDVTTYPTLHCAYYQKYDKSLLYVRIYEVNGTGMTGQLFDGNICRE